MIERDRDDTTPCLGERAKRNNDSLRVIGTGERQERETSQGYLTTGSVPRGYTIPVAKPARPSGVPSLNQDPMIDSSSGLHSDRPV